MLEQYCGHLEIMLRGIFVGVPMFRYLALFIIIFFVLNYIMFNISLCRCHWNLFCKPLL